MTTLQYIYGVFGDGAGSPSVDGSTSLSNVIPFAKGDKVTLDVHGADSSIVTFVASELPDWRTKLAIGRSFIALVDTDASVPWNSPTKVKFAGFVTKLSPSLGGVVTIKADGILAYLKAQAVTDLYDGTATNPNTKTTFTAGTWQGVLNAIVTKAFSISGIPVGGRPAQVLRSVSGSASGTGKTVEALASSFSTFGSLIEEVRDQLSELGNEVIFKPYFATAGMTRIVWDAIIGSDAGYSSAHYQEGTTATVTIEGESSLDKFSEFSTTYDIASVSTRIIGQSKFGDADAGTGADITARTTLSAGLPRLDSFYNPGIELTTAEMNAQLTSRLSFSTDFAEASYTIEEDFDKSWALKLGNTIVFTTADSSLDPYRVTVRLVSVDFSASTGKVKLGLMKPQPRYPVLPKQRKTEKDKQPIASWQTPNFPAPPGGSVAPPRPPVTTLPAGWSGSGMNSQGQLGIGSTQSPVTGFTQMSLGEIPEGSTISKIVGGYSSSIILLENGDLYATGNTGEVSVDGGIVGSMTVPTKMNLTAIDVWSGDTTVNDNNYNTGVPNTQAFLKISPNEVIHASGFGYKNFDSTVRITGKNSVILTNGEIWSFGRLGISTRIPFWFRTELPTEFIPSDIDFIAYLITGSASMIIFKNAGSNLVHRVTVPGSSVQAETLFQPTFGSIQSYNAGILGKAVEQIATVTTIASFILVDGRVWSIHNWSNATLLRGQGTAAVTSIFGLLNSSQATGSPNSTSLWALDSAGTVWYYGGNFHSPTGIPTPPSGFVNMTRFITSSTVDKIAAGTNFTLLHNGGSVNPPF